MYMWYKPFFYYYYPDSRKLQTLRDDRGIEFPDQSHQRQGSERDGTGQRFLCSQQSNHRIDCPANEEAFPSLCQETATSLIYTLTISSNGLEPEKGDMTEI